jgi:hypothetical protein
MKSKSSPHRCISPFVDLISKTPACIYRIEISKVPPPRSQTAIILDLKHSTPQARAAAVGSLMTSSPAICPASFVACRWASVKYAGSVITVRLGGHYEQYSMISDGEYIRT